MNFSGLSLSELGLNRLQVKHDTFSFTAAAKIWPAGATWGSNRQPQGRPLYLWARPDQKKRGRESLNEHKSVFLCILKNKDIIFIPFEESFHCQNQQILKKIQLIKPSSNFPSFLHDPLHLTKTSPSAIFVLMSWKAWIMQSRLIYLIYTE